MRSPSQGEGKQGDTTGKNDDGRDEQTLASSTGGSDVRGWEASREGEANKQKGLG